MEYFEISRDAVSLFVFIVGLCAAALGLYARFSKKSKKA